MRSANLFQSRITGGFFRKKLDTNAKVTIPCVYERFNETGRVEALKCRKSSKPVPICWDSDMAKWMEGAVYYLCENEDEKVRRAYDSAVCDIIENQLECGYYNPHFQVYEPENIFKKRTEHELYCAGHIFETAVAASKYIGDNRLLKFSERYVDYIYDRFVVKKDTAFTTPGHEEVELALLKLYTHTGKEKYKELAKFFINERGKRKEDEYASEVYNYSQSSMPVREQHNAEGHAVRALYLYTAIAELALIDGDAELKAVVEDIFNDIVNKKQYITGGLGSAHEGERFTYAYDLPNLTAYSETCASIAMAFFSAKMLELTGKAVYGDAFERVLYNGILSGVSLGGNEFFYVNPLEMDIEKVLYNDKVPWKQAMPIPQRVKLFECSCCPPNLCRFFGELPQYIYFEGDSEIIVSQYITSEFDGKTAKIRMVSDMPYSGKVSLTVNSRGKRIKLKLRVPYWSNADFGHTFEGYSIFEGVFDDRVISFDLGVKVRKVYANPHVKVDCNKVAFTYGPLVLCAERADNDFDLFAVSVKDTAAPMTEPRNNDFIVRVKVPVEVSESTDTLYNFTKPVKVKKILELLPYHAWANRGENDMKVWFDLR